MRLRQISLWVGLVAVLLSSGCCCHRRCGWRNRGCCTPTTNCESMTCCHPGGEMVEPMHPVYSAPPMAPMPGPTYAPVPSTLHAPMPVAK